MISVLFYWIVSAILINLLSLQFEDNWTDKNSCKDGDDGDGGDGGGDIFHLSSCIRG